MEELESRLLEIYNCQYNDIMSDKNDSDVVKYQKVASFCSVMFNSSFSDDEREFWNMKENECIQLAKTELVSNTPAKVQNAEVFKTDYKFSGSDERTLFQRFVDGKRTNNKWMYYLVTDNNFNYRNEAGQYFFDMNASVKERFDEITNYEHIVVDKEFLTNNAISDITPIGRRYILYVDKSDFEISTVAPSGSEMSIIHNGCRVFSSYEALAEYIEDRLKHKPVYVMAEGAFNALRYLISSIEIVRCPRLETPENYSLVKINFEKYSQFLSFSKTNVQHYTRKEKVIEEISSNPEFFSEYIRFKSTSKTTQEVNKDIIYELHTITKPSAVLNVFRWGRKTKNDENARFIQVQNVLLVLDEKMKLISVDIPEPDFIISNHTDYVIHERFRGVISLTSTDMERFNTETIEALQKLIQIQILTR